MAFGQWNNSTAIPYNQQQPLPQSGTMAAPQQQRPFQLSPQTAGFMSQYGQSQISPEQYKKAMEAFNMQRPQMPQNGGFVPPQYQQGQQGQMPPQGMPRLPMPPQGSVQQNNGVNRLGGTVVPSAPQMPQQGGNRFGTFMSQYGGGNGGQPSSSMTPTQQQALAQALQRKRAGMFGGW